MKIGITGLLPFVLYVKWFPITSLFAPAKGRIVVEKEWRQIRNPSLIQVALEIFCWHETTIYGII